ncbi:ABC transporter permease [Erythrobacter sp. R86502]|uniref:ABC transporter permease n=1 Tax=Erythrobacter sp. R86502 TaxID=3093846 RepID=UPI0036D3E9E0
MTIANILLVAKREMLQILKMRSFWLTLLILPAAVAIGPLMGESLADGEPTRVAVVDRSDADADAALAARFQMDETQYLLRELSRYVLRYELTDADPGASWLEQGRWYTPQDIAAFEAAGGIEAALAKIEAVRPDGVPTFDIPPHDYAFIAPPPALLNAPADGFAGAARALFADDTDADHPEIVVLIPEGYPADTRIGIYSSDEVRSTFVTKLQEVLTIDLRTRLLAEAGITGEQAALVQTIAPTLAIDTPPPGGGARETLLVRSIVPIALAYVLMMSLLLSGSWMLQGSIEERSNKLIESLLACITPEELMYGKLRGALVVGLMMISVWAGCAAVAAYATQGAIADLIRPALEPVSSPGIIAAILFFFIAGYVGISALFVGIGSMADSMSEAQGFMMPILLIILLPITFLLQAILLGSDGIVVHIFTWVPLWTPFAVLARLGLGIEAWELIGSGVLLTIAIVGELVLVGRLFRASLLASGQKPSFAKVIQRLKRAPGQG